MNLLWMMLSLNPNPAILPIVLFVILILATSEHEQRCIRNFKEKIKEQQSPFFARCFIKLGVLIFLLVLASASNIIDTKYIVLEYALMNLMIQFLNTSMSNGMLVTNRFKFLINIPTSFRTLSDTYQGIETLNSEIYSDRVATYTAIVPKNNLMR